MIKRIYVDNFKSLVNFSTDMRDMTVFIGNNSAGKSSVLQAIQFICGSIKEDYAVLLSKRNWMVQNVKSKCSGSSKIVFELDLSLRDDSKVVHDYNWSTEIIAYTSKNEMFLNSEKISVDGQILLDYKKGKNWMVKLDEGDEDTFVSYGNVIDFGSSSMKNLRKSKEIDPLLGNLISHLDNLIAFDLLTPDNMRLSSRGTSDVIESSGKNLPAFIKKMNAEQKERFMSKVKRLFADVITDIDTETKGQPGWTQIKITERYKNGDITISSKEMSDGMLRLIGLVAISEIRKNDAIYLLDEVENGINIRYVEKLMKIFEEMIEETGVQIILTTHSTLFMDYVNPDSIILLSKSDDGSTLASSPFDSEEVRSSLEYMYPGEVILNMSSLKE